MRNIFCVITLFSALSAFGNSMVITKAGDGHIVKNARKEGSNLICTAADTGKEITVPIAEITGTIPIVTPGTSYTVAQIDEALEKIDKVQKHKYLFRKINVIKAEWEGLKVSKSIDLGGELREIMDKVKSDPSYDNYRKALLDIGMVGYKHKGNVDKTAAIEKAKKTLRNLYMGIDLDALIDRCNSAEIDFDEYESIRAEAVGALGKKCIEADKKALTEAVVKARTTILANKTPFGKDLFKKVPTLDSYVKGLSMIGMLEDRIARTTEEKNALAREKQSFISDVQKAFGRIDFSNQNFPLSKADIIFKNTNAPYCSSYNHGDIKVTKEWALIIPTRAPIVPDLNSELNMPFTMIINRRPLDATEYGLMIASDKGSSINKHFIPLNGLAFKHAHASVPLRYNLARTGPGSAPLRDTDGEHILIYAAMKPSSSCSEWTVISKGCRIPVPYPQAEDKALTLYKRYIRVTSPLSAIDVDS